MGRRDPARQAAITAELAEMAPTVDEDIADIHAQDLDEQSRTIQETNELQQRADNVYAQIQRLGITPQAWFEQLAHPSIEDSIIKDKLATRWRVEMLVDDDEDLFMEQIKQDGDNYMCHEDPRRFENSAFDNGGNWDDWEYLDEWSGPALPMSAIRDL